MGWRVRDSRMSEHDEPLDDMYAFEDPFGPYFTLDGEPIAPTDPRYRPNGELNRHLLVKIPEAARLDEHGIIYIEATLAFTMPISRSLVEGCTCRVESIETPLWDTPRLTIMDRSSATEVSTLEEGLRILSSRGRLRYRLTCRHGSVWRYQQYHPSGIRLWARWQGLS